MSTLDEDEDDAPVDFVDGALRPSALNIPLNPQHIATFLSVVDAGGRLSAAAHQIGMSQPGVTHQLNELERRLNIRLLDRNRGRPAKLTRAGRLFERYGRSIVHLHSAMFAEMEQLQRRIGGHLRIGASPGPGDHWLPPLLCEFRESAPGLSIELHVADAKTIVEQVFDGDLEMGCVGGSWTRAGLDFIPVYQDQLALIAPPTHPLCKRKKLTIADLQGVEFVLQEPGAGMRMTLEQELSDRGLSLEFFQVIAELGNQESVKSAVAAGHGLGFVWRGAIEAEITSGMLTQLDVSDFHPDSNYYIVRRSHRRLSRRTIALLEFLVEQHGMPNVGQSVNGNVDGLANKT